jgi:hypothetical protein
MKSRNQIVDGGGWVKSQSGGKPKTRLFAVLSVIWLGVCVSASAPFWLDDWPPSFSKAEWLCLLLMLPEPIFIVMAVKFALTEKPRNITTIIPNPDYDIRKLY